MNATFGSKQRQNLKPNANILELFNNSASVRRWIGGWIEYNVRKTRLLNIVKGKKKTKNTSCLDVSAVFFS